MVVVEATRFPVEPRLQQAIEAAFKSFKPHGVPVSLRHMNQVVRATYPECRLTDEVLNSHIGDYAVLGGFNVHFDFRASDDAVDADVVRERSAGAVRQPGLNPQSSASPR